ncbi:MAG: acyl carrier protein [Pseudomonadota bacterium]
MAEFVESKVREIVAEQLGLGEDDVQPDASFSGDLGADTLDFMELIMAFEEEFELEIDDADVEGLRTVQDVVDYLSRRAQ